ALVRGELVRRAVLTALLHEHERAVVPHEEAREERRGRLEARSRPAPQARATHLGARARKAFYRTRGMLARGLLHAALDTEPVAHERNLAERDTGLRHAERAGVHADEECLETSQLANGARGPRIPLEIRLVRRPRVHERVVDVRHRRTEAQRVDRSREG